MISRSHCLCQFQSPLHQTCPKPQFTSQFSQRMPRLPSRVLPRQPSPPPSPANAETSLPKNDFTTNTKKSNLPSFSFTFHPRGRVPSPLLPPLEPVGNPDRLILGLTPLLDRYFLYVLQRLYEMFETATPFVAASTKQFHRQNGHLSSLRHLPSDK